jgi:hypothetical protein
LLLAIDLNGSLDAAPGQLGPMLRALREAGHHVSVLTGVSTEDTNDPEAAWNSKVQQMIGLGVGDVWDDMTVFTAAEGPDLAAAKAQYVKEHGVAVLIDNDRGNCTAAVEAGIPLAICPWATRVGSASDGEV